MPIAVSLPQELQEFVEQSVSSGQFENEAEMLIGALASLKATEDLHQLQIEKLRGELKAERDQVKRGGERPDWTVEDFKRRAHIHLLSIHLAVEQRRSMRDRLQDTSAPPTREPEEPGGHWRY